MTSKAEQERMWYLRTFAPVYDGQVVSRGWMNHRYHGVKKWDAVVANLVKRGLLEADEFGFYRATDAGVAAVKKWSQQ